MNQTIRNQISTYRRTLETKKANTAIYSIILLITLVVYDIYGVPKFFNALKLKYKTVVGVESLNRGLQLKLDNLSALKDSLLEANPYVEELKETVTIEPRVDIYMVSLVDNASSSGYVQRSMYVQNEEKNSTTLRSTFIGPVNQFDNFLVDIETGKRISAVEDFRYREEEGIANVELLIKIFHLEHQK